TDGRWRDLYQVTLFLNLPDTAIALAAEAAARWPQCSVGVAAERKLIAARLGPSDTVQVRAIIDSSKQRMVRGDCASFASQFRADWAYVYLNRSMVSGRAGIEQWCQSLQPVQKAIFTDLSIKGTGGDVLIRGRYRIKPFKGHEHKGRI